MRKDETVVPRGVKAKVKDTQYTHTTTVEKALHK